LEEWEAEAVVLIGRHLPRWGKKKGTTSASETPKKRRTGRVKTLKERGEGIRRKEGKGRPAGVLAGRLAKKISSAAGASKGGGL